MRRRWLVVVGLAFTLGGCEANIQHAKTCDPTVRNTTVCHHTVTYETQIYQP